MARRSIKLDNPQEFVEKVLRWYDEDIRDRADWAERRLQRYAKLFGWLEEKNYPWPNASNQHIPLLMTNSQRTQDTLVNAVLTTRPTVSAIAVNPGDADKGKQIDELQDYQLFVEQQGEEKIAFMADSFTNDGRFVCFVPWVKEKRKAREIHPVPALPEGGDPVALYNQTLAGMFPTGIIEKNSETTFTIHLLNQDKEDEPATAEFYEEDDQTFVIITKDTTVFDGPCPIPKPLEDVICPSRCDNLQPPSPSNPLGADHVMMVDWPSWDEVNRLAQSGYYDLLTSEDLDAMVGRVESKATDRTIAAGDDVEQFKIQKDSLAGQQYGNAQSASKSFTRLTFFGREALTKNGFEDEVVARIILGPDRGIKALARLRYLEEDFPRQDLARPRPFASSPAFIPIPGQWFGMGLPELLEHMHNLTKILLDQMIDKHTISNTPWFLYRAASGVRPEVIRMEPGMGYPVANPQQDFVFPQIPLNDQTIALNLITMVQQWAERQSMQGSLQMGSVPAGKSSALRTSTNMMSVLQQGDARPERILRRFFRGLADVYRQMHELNKVFLPPNKQFRITGVVPPGADPYQTIASPNDISGMFQFDFRANAINTDKAMLSQMLTELLPMLVNGMTLQMGIVTKEQIYNIFKDLIKSKGQDEHRYLAPLPDGDTPKITAEQAMGQMLQGVMPDGLPAEGTQAHLQALAKFQTDPRFIPLIRSDPHFMVIYQAYIQKVQQQALQEQQQAMMAQQFAATMGGQGGTGGPQGSVQPTAGQPVTAGPNQPMDESMPGAKGMMQ